MLNNLFRCVRLSKARKQIRGALTAAPLSFSEDVLDAYTRFAGDFETGPPQFQRIKKGGRSLQRTHIAESALALEALCVFCHLLNRLTSREGTEGLHEALSDPVTNQVSKSYSKVLKNAPGRPDQARSLDSVRAHIHLREAQYGVQRKIRGPASDDRESMIGTATSTILDALGRSENPPLRHIVRSSLLRQISAHDWQSMVNHAGATLDGRETAP